MIDLHLHTTASDGLLAPAALVTRAATAGLTTISVTDHDTVAGLSEASAEAAHRGIRLVAGIEVTAVEHDRDVHILGYFIDPASPTLSAFLAAQREDRVRRVKEMATRLEALGCRIDVGALLSAARREDRSVGRPALADALVAAGYAADRGDAFARLLGAGRPAFVPRRGVGAAAVIATIQTAGGVASLAHPGVLGEDDLIPSMAAAGLDALEVWHSDHDDQQRAHYAALAQRHRLARSGGSDYHGDGVHRASRLGTIALPPEEFAALESLARRSSRSSPRADPPGHERGG